MWCSTSRWPRAVCATTSSRPASILVSQTPAAAAGTCSHGGEREAWGLGGGGGKTAREGVGGREDNGGGGGWGAGGRGWVGGGRETRDTREGMVCTKK